MQPMARPGVKLHHEAVALSARPAARAVLGADALFNLAAAGLAVAGHVGGQFPGGQSAGGLGWLVAILLLCVLTTASAIGSMGLRPRAMSSRRRLGFVAILVAVLRGGPIAAWQGAQIAVVVWTGVVVVVLLQEGRRISRAIVDAGDDGGLGDDPSRFV